MTKVHGHITQLGISGSISQMRVRGSIAQGGYVFAFAPVEAPTLLTAATVNATQIDLGWKINSTRHIGHAIERTSVPGGLTGWIPIDTVLGATDVYSDKTCDPSTKYYYRARAYRYGIYSDYSNVDSDTTLSSFDFLAPSDLVASTFSTTEIGLTWVNNSLNAEGVSIERREETTEFAEIDTVLPDEDAYLDDTCVQNTLYYYRVRAYKGAIYSEYSNMASATTNVAMPTGLTLTLISGGVRIDWTDNSGGVAQTEIWGQSDGAASALLYIINAGIVTKNDTVVPVNLRYYKVRAKVGIVYSSFTAEVSIAMVGAELIINGTFDDTSSWTNNYPTEFVISGGILSINAVSYHNIISNLHAQIKTYKIELDVVYTSGALGFFYITNFDVSSSTGHKKYIKACLINHPIWEKVKFGGSGVGTFVGTVDNVSIREVLVP